MAKSGGYPMYHNPYDEVGNKEDQGEGALYNDPQLTIDHFALEASMESSDNSQSGYGTMGGPMPDHESPMNVGYSPFKGTDKVVGGQGNGNGR